MKTFEEWLALNHPEILDEDWKGIGKKIALGGALLGAGLGIGRLTKSDDKIPSQSETSPKAAEFLANRGGSETKPQAADYLSSASKESPAMKRWKERIKAHDRKQAERQKGTDKEIKSSSGTVD